MNYHHWSSIKLVIYPNFKNVEFEQWRLGYIHLKKTMSGYQAIDFKYNCVLLEFFHH